VASQAAFEFALRFVGRSLRGKVLIAGNGTLTLRDVLDKLNSNRL